MQKRTNDKKEQLTNHRFSKKLKALKCSHGLGAGLNVTVDNVRLTTGFGGLQSDNIKNRSVGGEESIEREPQVRFL